MHAPSLEHIIWHHWATLTTSIAIIYIFIPLELLQNYILQKLHLTKFNPPSPSFISLLYNKVSLLTILQFECILSVGSGLIKKKGFKGSFAEAGSCAKVFCLVYFYLSKKITGVVFLTELI